MKEIKIIIDENVKLEGDDITVGDALKGIALLTTLIKATDDKTLDMEKICMIVDELSNDILKDIKQNIENKKESENENIKEENKG